MNRPLPSVALLGAAAALFAAVSVDRWWPCAALGTGSQACFERQDDSYSGLGTLLGHVEAPLLAVGYVLIAVAVVLAGWSGRRGLALLAAGLPAVLAIASLGLGGGGWIGSALVVLTFAAGPLAAASLPTTAGSRTRIAYGVGLTATSILVDHMVLAPLISLGYTSHDTNPWTWLPTGLGCLVAAVTLARVPRASTPVGVRSAAPAVRA